MSDKKLKVSKEIKESISSKSNPINVKIIDEKKVEEWRQTLYEAIPSNEIIQQWSIMYKYAGFDRIEVLNKMMELKLPINTISEIIVVCAMRGPQRASSTMISDNMTIASHGIPGSGQKGTKGLSCARITAATADLAAFYLKRMNFPKRLKKHDCPGWLQFPSAGSIKLPDTLRSLHRDFSIKFSPMIGGVFSEDIYDQMVENAYYDNKLNLFESQ
jgi:hypothetical protein